MATEKVKIASAIVAYLLSDEEVKKPKKRRIWVREWVSKRQTEGCYNKLFKELRSGDELCYKNFIRMSPSDFDYIVQLITPLIRRKDTHLRDSISVGERLALTLRFLATGDSYHSLMYLFRIPVCTISMIVPEVCEAIYGVLKDEHLKVPNSEKEWLKIAKEFETKWQFPNCIGALDGKHVVIKAPANSGSLYFNYKGSHSIVLMGLADANYKFIYIDIGASGRSSDGGVFNQCSLANALETNKLNIPSPRHLCEGNITPYVIVADDAFSLKPYIMKPFPFRNLTGYQRIFNYRLSRARRIIENAFGIASAKFRVLRKPMELNPERAKKVVLSVCALHNFLISSETSKLLYIQKEDFDKEDEQHILKHGTWRKESPPEKTFFQLDQQRHRNATTSAKSVRENFQHYFITEGEVPWQYKFI